MLDYVLKTSPSDAVILEISDSSGKLVRRFSSADKPDAPQERELNVPTYWIRPPRTLLKSPGMHRFLWDLHYPQPAALERDYPISAIVHDTPLYPLGPAALPGTYSVKLTASGKTSTQSLTIKMDPRVKISSDDLKAQFELETKIVAAMERDFAALAGLRDLRVKLRQIQAADGAGLQSKIAELDKKAADLEGTPGGYGASFLSTPDGRGLARLNAALNNLLATADSADAAPTTQAVATFEEVNRALGEQLERWAEMQKRDIPALNQELKHAGVAEINLKPAP